MEGLAPGDLTLHRLARHDPDASVRARALERLADADLLLILAREDEAPQCRLAATERLTLLLEGRCEQVPPLEDRIAFMLRWDAAGVAERLLREAGEGELRLAALARVRDPAALARAALADPAQEVRLAALARITDEAALEQAVRDARGRSKTLYRAARERLETIRRIREQERQAQEICVELEHLAEQRGQPPDLARLHQLDQAWAALPDDCRDEARFSAARRTIAERVNAAADAAHRRREILGALERLADSLSGKSEDPAPQPADAGAALENLIAQWDGSAGDAGGSERRQFEAARAAARAALLMLERDHERCARCEAVLAQAERVLATPGAIPEREVRALERAWQERPEPEAAALAAGLRQRWGHVFGRMQERLQQQEQRLEDEQAQLAETLHALEAAVAHGNLQEALALRDRFRHQVGESIALPRPELARLEAEVRRLEPAMGELRDWRRWGTRQVREQLCDEAEALAAGQLSAHETGAALKALRNQWKTLDAQSGPAPQALWQRFDAACNRAYEPVKAMRETESARRTQAREQRHALCAEAEATLANLDWTEPDWRGLERVRQRLMDRWNQAGTVDRRDQRTLDKRLKTALKPLDQRLDAERRRERDRRRGMLDHLAVLADGDDLALAIRTAKAVQAEWMPTVRLARREEEALWAELRALCDRIFARRDVERRQSDDEHRQRHEQFNALCAQAEELAGRPEASAIEALEEQWRSRARGGGVDAALEQRFRSALGDARRGLDRATAEARLARLRTVVERARLCRELEQAVLAGTGGDTGPWDARWEQLGPPPEPLPDGLVVRYQRARDALAGDAGARQDLARTCAETQARQTELCLELEILAGVDSPPELADARLRRQVGRLSESLSGAAAPADDPDTAIERLLLDWAGTCGDAAASACEARVDRVLAALRPRGPTA